MAAKRKGIYNMWTPEYHKIIDFAISQNRKKLKQTDPNYEYYENHHIIPECFFKNRSRKGPSGWLDGNPEDPDNKVLLTAEEHFIAHQILALMYPSNIGILNAVVQMSGKFTITLKEFAEIKQNFSARQSKALKGKPKPPGFAEKIRKLKTGVKRKEFSQEWKDNISKGLSGERNGNYGKDKSGDKNPMFGKFGKDNPNFGSKRTEETKEKIRVAALGRKREPFNQEWLDNLSKAAKGKKKKVVVCEHCKKSGGVNMMHRWHFDNCKTVRKP